MDVFDVLTAISKRKVSFIPMCMNEHDALAKAMFDMSQYHSADRYQEAGEA